MVFAIGIDLGTSFSCVGVYRNGNVEIIANKWGSRVTPSCVAYTKTGILIGAAAKETLSVSLENIIYDAKRVIGRTFSEIPENDIQHWPFQLVNSRKMPKFEVTLNDTKKLLSPEEVSAEVLKEMRQIAVEYLNEDVYDAVITIPAHFNDSQRQATKDAAKIAGLNVLQLLNEPAASAFAYGMQNKLQTNENILVFDLGGGTFDVSILTVGQNDIYEVKAVGGDTHLGGEDFNNNMLDYFLNEINQKHSLDLTADRKAKSRLLKECEKAKIALSSSPVAKVHVKGIINGANFESNITRATFEDMNEQFFNDAIRKVDETIKNANITKYDIQEVLLVGGSTYIPKIQKMLLDYFDGKALNKSIKPDEAVAFGAAVFAANLRGEALDEHDMVLLDVTPLSLGIEYRGGLMHTLVQRNSTIPLKVTCNRFSTATDNQKSVRVKIFEGERKFVRDNKLLGKFSLTNLPPAPARKLKIEVTLEIDVNGILKVSAVEKATGNKNMIKVDAYKEGLGVDVENDIIEGERRAADDEAEFQLRRFQNKKSQHKPIEVEGARNYFVEGSMQFEAKNYNSAFNIFTKALKIDENFADAMEKRAHIHFYRGEYEDCVIECEGYLKVKTSEVIQQLLEKAKNKIPEERKWHIVFNVSPVASAEDVTKAYHQLSKIYSPNANKNGKLFKLDKLKMQEKMTILNIAKDQFDKKNAM